MRRAEQNIMNNKGQAVGVLIILAIGLIVGLVLLSGGEGTISSNIGAATEKANTTENLTIVAAGYKAAGVVNETYGYELSRGGCPMKVNGWRRNAGSECSLTIQTVTSGNMTPLVLNTDYFVNTTSDCGTSYKDIRFDDSTLFNSSVRDVDNRTKITYTSCGDEYVAGSTNQTILDLVILMTAIALLVYALSGGLENWGISFK